MDDCHPFPILAIAGTLFAIASLAALADPASADELLLTPGHVDLEDVSPGCLASCDLALDHLGGAYCATAMVEVLDRDEWPHLLDAVVWGEPVSSPGSLALPVWEGVATAFRLTVVPPESATAGDYFLQVRAFLVDRPEVENASTVHVKVTYVRGATLRLHDSGQANVTGLPGDPVELVLKLTNLGNSWDKYRMEVSAAGAGSAWVRFWSEGVGQDSWTPTLSVFYTLTLKLTVWVPTSGLVGERVDLTVRATSAADPTSFIAPLKVSVGVGLVGALRVTSYFRDKTLDPARSTDGWATLMGSVQVDNLGNGPDTVRLSGTVLDVTDPDLAAFGSDPVWLDIERLASGTFSVWLKVRARVPAGWHTLVMYFGSVDPRLHVSLPLSFEVRDAISFSVACARPDQAAVPGDQVTFELSVVNTGNAKATINLSTDHFPEGWAVELRPSDIVLLQGEAGTVAACVTVGEMLDVALLPHYSIKVVAAHHPSSLKACCDLVVRLEPTHRLEWCVRGRPVTTEEDRYAPTDALGEIPFINPFCADPDWCSTGISVVNLGNVNASFDLSTWSTPPSIELAFSPSTGLLRPGERADVAVGLVAAHDLEPGPYLVTMAVHCPEVPSFLTRVLPLHLKVSFVDVAVRSHMMVWVGEDPVTTMGLIEVEQTTRLTLEATLRNLCPDPVADAMVVLMASDPSGRALVLDHATVSLASNGYARATFNWTALRVGHHVLTIEVRLPDQARSDNDAVSLEVQVLAREAEGSEQGGLLPESSAAFVALAVAVLAFVLWRVWGGPRAGRRSRKRPRERHVIALRSDPSGGRPGDR